VSFLFRNLSSAKCPWHMGPVAGPVKLQRHWQLPPLGFGVVLPIKSTRPICTRNSCVKNVGSRHRDAAGSEQEQKVAVFVMELLQSLETATQTKESGYEIEAKTGYIEG